MEANERLINTFATRVRQMLLQYQELKKENAELYAMVDERDRQLRDVEEKLSGIRRDYDNLKMAKMLAVSDGDIETSRKRVNHATEWKVTETMPEDELNKINIKLNIYDRVVELKVPREEESLYRKDAELINALLNVYYDNFKGLKEDKEITYFAMVDLGLRLQRELQRNDTKPYDDILQRLTSEIETVLKAE